MLKASKFIYSYESNIRPELQISIKKYYEAAFLEALDSYTVHLETSCTKFGPVNDFFVRLVFYRLEI